MEVKMFVQIAGAKIWNSCDQQRLIMEGMEDLGQNSTNFSYSQLDTFHGSTLMAVVSKWFFVGWYFPQEKQ